MNINSNTSSYRLLKEGEIIKLGHQFLIGKTWKTIEEGNPEIGTPYSSGKLSPVRTLVEKQ